MGDIVAGRKASREMTAHSVPIPVPYDFALVALSVAIAIAASYAFLDLAARGYASSARLRWLWVGFGSLALGSGVWTTHFMAMAAYRMPVTVHYDPTLVLSSCIVAIAATAVALSIAGRTDGDPISLAGASVIVGGGVVAMHEMGMSAMQVGGIGADPWWFLGAAAIAASGATFGALILAFRVRDERGTRARTTRWTAALLLGGAIVGLHYVALRAIDVSSMDASVASSDIVLPIMIGIVSLALILVVLGVSFVDRRRRIVAERVRPLARESGVAATLQHALLPRSLPVVEGVKIATAYLPGSRGDDVGGDWFDAFLLEDGRIGLSVGDVSGRGITAAVTMNLVRQSLRAAAYEDADPGSVLFRANRLLVRSETATMVTAIFGVLDPITLEFRYASAGHPLPLVGGNSGSIETLEATGVPLGIFDDYDSTTKIALLDAGAILVLYTDGFIEFSRDVIAGTARLHRAIEVAHAQQVDDPARAIYESVLAEHERSDDAAIMTIQLAQTIGPFEIVLPALGPSAALARNALRRYIEGIPLGAERRFDLLLCAGEAIGNAIEHAYIDCRAGEFRVHARTVDSVVIVEVADDGRWRDARMNDNGRGIPLMRSLMDNVEISESAVGTRIQLAISLCRRATLV